MEGRSQGNVYPDPLSSVFPTRVPLSEASWKLVGTGVPCWTPYGLECHGRQKGGEGWREDLQGQGEDIEHSVIVMKALSTEDFLASFLAELSALNTLAVKEPFLSLGSPSM